MENSTKGAWIAHHAEKLEHVTVAAEFSCILTAGKMCRLLSALSRDETVALDDSKVEAYARAVGINPHLELKPLLGLLEQEHLIVRGQKGLDVLGVNPRRVIEHTGTAFERMNPKPHEDAVIQLAELTSRAPVTHDEAVTYLSDRFPLVSKEATELLGRAVDINFVDVDSPSAAQRIYFNGNLFRRDNLQKVQRVLQSLSSDDQQRVCELDAKLESSGCVVIASARQVLGGKLFKKLHSIGMYDVGEVANDQGSEFFVTRPAAFGKFGNAFEDDALNLAKAFVACLTYGITIRKGQQGRITAMDSLLKRLVAGEWVGPATAIGEDYRVLEKRGVLELRREFRQTFSMRLLKKDVGRLAREVLSHGDASAESTTSFPSISASSYTPPEPNRVRTRRALPPSRKEETELLLALRTGKL